LGVSLLSSLILPHVAQAESCDTDGHAIIAHALSALQFHTASLDKDAVKRVAGVGGCYGYVRFRDDTMQLFRMTGSSTMLLCGSTVMTLTKDVSDPREVLYSGKAVGLVAAFSRLEWGSPECGVLFVGRDTGVIEVARSSESETTMWFKGDLSKEISVTIEPEALVHGHVEVNELDEVAALLFDTPDIHNLTYLGDRGTLGQLNSGSTVFYLFSSPRLTPLSVCAENGLKRFEAISPPGPASLSDYINGGDKMFRDLVVTTRKALDPAVFMFSCP
jgi:hypothetical protein